MSPSKISVNGRASSSKQSVKLNGDHVKAAENEMDKAFNGTAQGVKSPSHKNDGSVAVPPNWGGPQPDNTKTAKNGNPFEVSVTDDNGHAQGDQMNGPALAFRSGSVRKPTPMDFLNRNSEADVQPLIVTSPTNAAEPQSKQNSSPEHAVRQPVGTFGASVTPSRKFHYTTDVGPDVVSPGGHYVKIDLVQSKPSEVADALKVLLVDLGWKYKITGVAAPPPTGSSTPYIVFRFDDIRDASAAIDEAAMGDSKWVATYITQYEFAEASKHYGQTQETTFHDGQVIFAAQFEGEGSAFKDDRLYGEVRALAQHFGELIGIEQAKIVRGTWEFRAEFFKITAAKDAIDTIGEAVPTHLQGWTVAAREMSNYSPVKTITATPHRVVQAEYATYIQSPTGRTAWKIDENGERVVIEAPLKVAKSVPAPIGTADSPTHSMQRQSDPIPQTPQNAFGNHNMARRGSWPHPNFSNGADSELNFSPNDSIQGAEPQVIDPKRILDGHDVRTTVMLRNLPNNITQKRFKAMLDVVSKGKYDFSYLRIDFAKGTNVGYGFVNFTDPIHIVEFLEFYDGHPWCPELKFSSRVGPRLARMAYATTQGIDCTVEKFRNSSVMLENPEYRPKLWYTSTNTSDTSLIGQERPFPGVNNEAKARRSAANAGSEGLYKAPRSDGRGGRWGRGRGSQSQYDRGTPAQIQEDAAYHQMMMPPAGFYDPYMMMMGGQMYPPQTPVGPYGYGPYEGFGFPGTPFNNPGTPFNNGGAYYDPAQNAMVPYHTPSPYNGMYAPHNGGPVGSPLAGRGNNQRGGQNRRRYNGYPNGQNGNGSAGGPGPFRGNGRDGSGGHYQQ